LRDVRHNREEIDMAVVVCYSCDVMRVTGYPVLTINVPEVKVLFIKFQGT